MWQLFVYFYYICKYIVVWTIYYTLNIFLTKMFLITVIKNQFSV